MRNPYRVIGIAFTCLILALQAKATDQVIAKTERYLVIVRIEDDTGIAMLVKVDADGKKKVIAGDENIAPKIEKLLPRKDALALIKQMVSSEVKGAGGAKKFQKGIDEKAKQFGKEFFNYLTPLQIELYKANGVNIPQAKTAKP